MSFNVDVRQGTDRQHRSNAMIRNAIILMVAVGFSAAGWAADGSRA